MNNGYFYEEDEDLPNKGIQAKNYSATCRDILRINLTPAEKYTPCRYIRFIHTEILVKYRILMLLHYSVHSGELIIKELR